MKTFKNQSPLLNIAESASAQLGVPLFSSGAFFMQTKLEFNEEVWKDVVGYEGLYRVSNLGRVTSLPKPTNNQYNNKEIVMKPRIRGGYWSVKFLKKDYPVHRLVAQAFILNKKNKPAVNHIDSNKLNNCNNNLEWVTNRENSIHHFTKQQTSSKYIGVSWNKALNKWDARMTYNKRQIFLGYFDSELDAAQAYQTKLKEICQK